MEEKYYEIEKIAKQKICQADQIISCKNYISTLYKKNINIYEMDENLDFRKIGDISSSNTILDFDFNYKYRDILLTVPNHENIKIYKILNNEKPEVICTLNRYDSIIPNNANFNPFYENVIVSYEPNTIDFWDINKYIGINTIKFNEIISNVKWDISGNYFGYIKNLQTVIINNMGANMNIDLKINDIRCFEFKNNYEIITFHQNNDVKIFDIRNYSKPKLEMNNIKFNFEIYDKNNDFIYLNKDLFKIYDSTDFHKEYDKQIDFIKKPTLLDFYCTKNNEIAHLIDQDIDGVINIIKIKKQNNQTQHTAKKDEKKIEDSKEFIQKIVFMITNYSSLSQDILQKKDMNFIDKKYMHIKEVEKELENIKYVLLPDRKKYVEDEIKTKFGLTNVYDEYINYIKLLIRDNTNKTLLIKYLTFLKDNETTLSKITHNFEAYKDEVEYYKVCFDKKEYKNYFDLTKEKSEKDNLLEFMKNFIKIKNKEEFNKMCENIKEMAEYPYFNQPITGENKELMYFKNKLLIYDDIFKSKNNDNIYPNRFELLKNFYNLIIEENYLGDNNITKDLHKFNILTSLIISPEEDENYNRYILNLLNSEKCSDKDILEIQNKCSEDKYLLKLLSNIGGIDNCKEKLCKNNLFKYIDKINEMTKIISNIKDLYNYECLLFEKNNDINLSKIKLFLKTILKGNMFKNIYKLLYTNEDFDIISKDEFIDDYIDNHLFLIPYKSENYCGITDRFSCNSYIFFGNNIVNENKEINKDMTSYLISSRFIAITFHEFNHYIFSYILHSCNYKNITFNSPRKKELILNEGGYLMELILFGKIIDRISFEEASYILDENNYLKNEIEFQKEYINISSKNNLEIKGSIYSNINHIIKQPNFKNLRSIFIKAKIKIEEEPKKIRRNNCVFGRNISLYYYNKKK